MIYNLLEEEQKNIFFKSDLREAAIIGISINDDILTCKLKREKKEHIPDILVIDLKKGVLVNQYRIPLELKTENYARLETLLINEKWAYLGDDSGKVVALNLTNQEPIVLGEHKERVSKLSIDGQILMSFSKKSLKNPAEIKFWDLNSMTLINKIDIPFHIKDCKFIDGKLYAAIEGSLVQWDYLVSHEGEEFTQHSQKEIEVIERCLIQ